MHDKGRQRRAPEETIVRQVKKFFQKLPDGTSIKIHLLDVHSIHGQTREQMIDDQECRVCVEGKFMDFVTGIVTVSPYTSLDKEKRNEDYYHIPVGCIRYVVVMEEIGTSVGLPFSEE